MPVAIRIERLLGRLGSLADEAMMVVLKWGPAMRLPKLGRLEQRQPNACRCCPRSAWMFSRTAATSITQNSEGRERSSPPENAKRNFPPRPPTLDRPQYQGRGQTWHERDPREQLTRLVVRKADREVEGRERQQIQTCRHTETSEKWMRVQALVQSPSLRRRAPGRVWLPTGRRLPAWRRGGPARRRVESFRCSH